MGRKNYNKHLSWHMVMRYREKNRIYVLVQQLNTIIIYNKYKKHLKMNKEIGMILPKKRVNASGVGERNNYYEDIYNIYTSLQQHLLTTPIDSTH